MTTASRGLGVAGALAHEIVRPLATEAEQLGYATFWANDTPNGDGLASLAAAASVTESIRLGVGVIAVDRVPAERIVERVAELGLPVNRLLIGIGSGRTKIGSLDLIQRSATVLREAGLTSAVGALGPNMIALSGEVADAVLLNWLTPAAAVDSTAALRNAAAGRTVESIAYVRVGCGAGSSDRLAEEAGRYESIPAYADHFARMGVTAVHTCIGGDDPSGIQDGLTAFADAVDEVVARAIVGEETLERYLTLARAAAPQVR